MQQETVDPDKSFIVVIDGSTVFASDSGINIGLDLEDFTNAVLHLKDYSFENKTETDIKGNLLQGILGYLGMRVFNETNCPEEFQDQLKALEEQSKEDDTPIAIRFILVSSAENIDQLAIDLSGKEEAGVIH